MTFTAGEDVCLGFWKAAWDAHIVTFPPGAQVLEIGCAEADWMTPMLQARPDLHLTGIDRRDCQRPGTVIVGDVLQHEFPPASFDAVVAVSTLEHIGLGAYEHDPIEVDGDVRCVDRLVTWLKPGGWVYFDVPYRPTGPYRVEPNFRAYDEAQLQARLIRPGLRERWCHVHHVDHPDAPYLSVVCDRV